MFITSLSALALAAGPQPAAKLDEQLIGVYTNEEQVYFEDEAGRTPPPWIALKIEQKDDELVVTRTDAFGEKVAPPQTASVAVGVRNHSLTLGKCTVYLDPMDSSWTYSAQQKKKLCRHDYQITGVSPEGLTVRLSDGKETILKRARPALCWAAIRKPEPKADGSEDWHFVRNLDMHDQGGRIMVKGDDKGTEPLILRMRSVYWPKPSTNRPTLVLYIHKIDDPKRAVSYSWADINASRVGVNLRWMQASCTINGAERPSATTSKSFRG